MNTESNLDKLIKAMTPVLMGEEYVFHASTKTMRDLLALEPVSLFQEKEGVSAVLKKEIADKHNLEYAFVCRMITLNVYSDLEAVGFLAAITTKLAAAGISVNPLSAYYHDHLFVPADKADLTMNLLNEMTHT